MKKDSILILSSASLVYFATLIYISFKKILLNDVIEALFEFATIPFILLLAVLFVFSFKGWYDDNWEMKSKAFFAVLILVSTLFLIIIATVYNI